VFFFFLIESRADLREKNGREQKKKKKKEESKTDEVLVSGFSWIFFGSVVFSSTNGTKKKQLRKLKQTNKKKMKRIRLSERSTDSARYAEHTSL
jgi:hypothetical protein